MKRGRPELQHPKTAWKVHVDSRLAAEIEILLADPLRGKAAYGERGSLIEQLLRQWVEGQRKGATP